MRIPPRGRLLICLSPLFLWLCACSAPRARPQAPAPRPPEITISVVGTSDLHGHVEPVLLDLKDRGGRVHRVARGGLPLLGGFLANLRARRPVVLLDGGDLFQGTLISNLGEGQVVIDAYNALGYTAAAVGNHEFDFGPVGVRAVPRAGSSDDPQGALKARMAAARFPFLAANIIDDKTSRPIAWGNVFPSRMIEVAGVRIGLVGAITEETPRTTNALNLRGLSIGKIVPAVRAEAQGLRQRGAAAVLLAIHEGANCKDFRDPRDLSSCMNDDERIITIARELGADLDVIVAGHSHAGVAHLVGATAVIQSYMSGRAFGRVDLTFRQTGDGLRLDPDRTRVFPPQEVCQMVRAEGSASSRGVDARHRCDAEWLGGADLVPMTYEGLPVTESAEVRAAIAPHAVKAEEVRSQPIGVTATERLRRHYRGESPLGALLADLIREGAEEVSGAKVDVAFQNGGGIRDELPAGPLTYGDLHAVLPFDNRLAIMRVPGRALVELYAENLRGSGGVLVPSGLSVEARCANEKLSISVLDGRGKPLAPDRLYTVAVSDFLASGGDNFGSILGGLAKDAVTFYDDSPPLRDVVLRALRRHPTISPPAGAARLRLSGPRPMRCAPKGPSLSSGPT